MDKEIEKLKKDYLDTPVPHFLVENGFDDVLLRIGGDYEKKRFYLSRYVMIAVLVIVILAGFSGITFASKPNTALYPIKVAAQKAIAGATHTTPENVESKIDRILKIKPSATPTPTVSTIPTPSRFSSQDRREAEQGNENIKSEGHKNETENSIREDVKGVSISPTSAERQKTETTTPTGTENRAPKQDNNNSQSNEKSHEKGGD